MTFYELIKACERAVTHAEIRRLLHSVKDDANIRELFRLMLCPSIVYNIKAVPDGIGGIDCDIIRIDKDLVEEMYILINEEIRGATLKRRIRGMTNRSFGDHREVLSWILARKNPAKVGKVFVNGVWPGLIRTQRYMGAVPGSDESLIRLFNEAPYVNVQDKIDGQTGLVDYLNGKAISMHTRQGNRIDQFFPEFMQEMSSIFYTDDKLEGFTGMMHHEILVGTDDSPDAPTLPRAKGNGLINKQIKNGVVGGNLDTRLKSVLLDLADDDMPDMHQAIRYHNIAWFSSSVSKRVNQIKLTLDTAREYAQKLISAGGEGVVCKHPEMPFKNGKHWNNVKIKNEFCVDLEVIDWKAHSKDDTLLGALLMATSDKKLQVWVNLKCDLDREQDYRMLDGDILRVKAECVTTSKSKVTRSLSLPRFDGDEYNEYQHEKDIADTLDEVLIQEAASKSIM